MLDFISFFEFFFLFFQIFALPFLQIIFIFDLTRDIIERENGV